VTFLINPNKLESDVHNHDHIANLATAAQFFANQTLLTCLPNVFIPGYLLVQDTARNVRLLMHVSAQGRQCEYRYVDLAQVSNDLIFKHPHNIEGLRDGTTSSDVDPKCAGSVAAAGLAIGYASRDCQIPMDEEAVAMMIAYMAGSPAKKCHQESVL